MSPNFKLLFFIFTIFSNKDRGKLPKKFVDCEIECCMLDACTVKYCNSIVSISSNFDRLNFTTAAFDNFDHEEATISGMNGFAPEQIGQSLEET